MSENTRVERKPPNKEKLIIKITRGYLTALHSIGNLIYSQDNIHCILFTTLTSMWITGVKLDLTVLPRKVWYVWLV